MVSAHSIPISNTLIIDSTEEYREVFSEIKSEIETANDEEETFYEENYSRIGLIQPMIYL